MPVMRMNWEKGCWEPVKFPELKRGQIIHSYSGMCGCCHERSVLVSMTHDQWGTHYRTINLETHEYDHLSAPKPFESRGNSLGSFFKANEILPEEEVKNYERLAQELQNRKRAEAEILRIQAEQEQAVGRALFDAAIKKHGMPRGVLIARLEKDESDVQTDYFSSRTVRTVILAFSKHRRNNFKEFRKAAICSDIPEIQKLATAPASWERRENYSMGSGYYLAQDNYSGWQIRKIPVDTMDHLIQFYGDAGKPGNFCIK